MTRPSIKNIAKAIKSFREIQDENAKKNSKTKEKYTQIYRQLKKDEKPPEEFEGSSFLFMRSYDSDNGNRPFSDTVFWLSPDLTVAPANDPTGYTRDLVTGNRYTITATLRNRGDLNIPSAKIEFYLCNPTLGFDTRFADLLGITTSWVAPMNSKQASINHNFTATQSGHKCLFARAFSFSPQDIPLDPYKLDPRIDRHIAQLNLNIVNQGTSYKFQTIHLPNVMDTLILKPVSERSLLKDCNYLFKDFKFNSKTSLSKFLSKPRLRIKENNQDLRLSIEHERISMRGESNQGPSFDEQKNLHGEFNRFLKMNQAGRKVQNQKELIKRFRAMNKEVIKTDIQLEIPNLGLKEGEITAFDIVRRNEISGRTEGGIRIIIKG